MVLLRHRQRAVSAVTRGRWIIPKRTKGGAWPPPGATEFYTMTVGESGIYVGYSSGYGAMVPGGIFVECRVQNGGLVLVSFVGSAQRFGPQMNLWAEGYEGSPITLPWTGSRYDNVSQTQSVGYHSFLTARIGQDVEHGFAAA